MGLKSIVEKVPFYDELVLPLHWGQAVVAGMKNGWPGKKMRVIAVTGTNGKTTTCFMIWKMLNEAGHRTGLLTTVAWGGVNGDENDVFEGGAGDFVSGGVNGEASGSASGKMSGNASGEMNALRLHKQFEHMTTERVGVLNARMRAIAEAGAEFLVLETTSHALVQFRTLGVPVEVGVFTNITHEHLDYHKTFAKYRAAKMKLFKKAKYGVINADDPNAEYFVRVMRRGREGKSGARADSDYASGDILTYGVERGDLRATEVELMATGVKYLCHDINGKRRGSESEGVAEKGFEEDGVANGDFEIETQIPGKFNVYNSLAAVGVGRRVGLSNEEIARGIRSLTSVEGRMTRVREGQDFEVIVDYAHAPDALVKVFESVGREATASKISASTGALLARRTQSTARSDAPVSLNSSEAEASRGGEEVTNEDEGAVRKGEEVARDNGRKIISVHGGAGRRDPSTRAIRGEILGRESDIVIITEDDSRDEDPKEIAAAFVEGAEKAGKKLGEDLFVEMDREQAIRKAIGMASAGDLVLILGKGHEKTILRADGPHEFEDIKVAQRVLRERPRK